MRDPDTGHRGMCSTCAGRLGLHPARSLPALLQHSLLWGPPKAPPPLPQLSPSSALPGKALPWGCPAPSWRHPVSGAPTSLQRTRGTKAHLMAFSYGHRTL